MFELFNAVVDRLDWLYGSLLPSSILVSTTKIKQKNTMIGPKMDEYLRSILPRVPGLGYFHAYPLTLHQILPSSSFSIIFILSPFVLIVFIAHHFTYFFFVIFWLYLLAHRPFFIIRSSLFFFFLFRAQTLGLRFIHFASPSAYFPSEKKKKHSHDNRNVQDGNEPIPPHKRLFPGHP